MPLSAAQKASLAQFVSFTQADRKVAERTLKAHGWNVQQAVNAYFSNGNPDAQRLSSTGGANAQEGRTSQLSKMFDKYRDDPNNSPDTISITGTMKYLADLSISLDSISVLIISELLQSPTMGELTRSGFLTGWTPHGATTLSSQKTVLANSLTKITQPAARTDPDGLFRRVYKATFRIALPSGQRAVPLDMALEYWKLLFGSEGFEWRSADGMDWLPLWSNFLAEKWRKAVNRDLWEQTLLFALRTVEAPGLEWWSEESAWPGVVDEFVAHVKEQRAKEAKGDEMDVS